MATTGSPTVRPDTRFLPRPAYGWLEGGVTPYDFATLSRVVKLGASDWQIESTAVDTTAAELNRLADVSTSTIPAGSTEAVAEATHAGRTILLDTLAGSVCTLPAAGGTGGRYRFVVTVVPTSNAHIIKVNATPGTDVIKGQIHIGAGDSTATAGFLGAGTNDTLTLNGTTTGGSQIGDWVEFEDTLAANWTLKGYVTATIAANIVTPFSATVP